MDTNIQHYKICAKTSGKEKKKEKSSPQRALINVELANLKPSGMLFHYID